jgi:hypothetical protein
MMLPRQGGIIWLGTVADAAVTHGLPPPTRGRATTTSTGDPIHLDAEYLTLADGAAGILVWATRGGVRSGRSTGL